MLSSVVFIYLAYTGQGVYSQQVCGCANVRVVPVDLYEFAGAGPLYSQVASTATQALALDNICYTSGEIEYGVVDMAMALVYQNGTTSTLFLRQAEVEPGVFQISGDTDYNDYILGEPCEGTYVIYRCFTRRLPCPTNVDGTIVIIESIDEFTDRRCIERGIEIARRHFPGIRFYTLPMELDTNCAYYY